MATHYQSIVMPARVRSSRDKESVEGSVNIVTTWIIQALRNTTCFSLEELNKEIWRKLETLNHRPFQNRPGSRWSAFLEEGKRRNLPFPLFQIHHTNYLNGEKQKSDLIIILPLIVCFILFRMN